MSRNTRKHEVWNLWLHRFGQLRWRSPTQPNARPLGAEWTLHGPVKLTTTFPRQILSPLADLPEGAALADPAPQRCGMGGPRLVYVPMNRRCKDCGVTFIFSVAEQRYWYETLRFWNESVPTTCPGCRRTVQRYRDRQRALTDALRATEAAPADAEAWLRAARATCDMRDLVGDRAIERGIGYARRAARRADLATEGAEIASVLQATRASRAASTPRLP